MYIKLFRGYSITLMRYTHMYVKLGECMGLCGKHNLVVVHVCL